MNGRKVYVNVLALFDKDGNITPLLVEWENGKRYEIDTVLDVRRSNERTRGNSGMRYTVRIGKNRTALFYEDPAWFVERKQR